MIKKVSISVPPSTDADETLLKIAVAEQIFFDVESISFIRKIKRSIDARSKYPVIRLELEVYLDEPAPQKKYHKKNYPDVSTAETILIVGAGPAGLFTALKLIELGKKPLIIERGKDVRARRRDLAILNKEGIVDPNSNYCFGEGGAGTYSDGKLYTRSTKRGNVNAILETFVEHGADENILVEAHPHIGTNKLPNIIEKIRETILSNGGEIHFNCRVTDLIIKNNEIKGIIASDKEFISEKLILATGHSARDIFELLSKKNILIESKPFAMGVRIEHPQSLIDTMQYHCEKRDEYLPPASYSFVEQVKDRGVFSFCMCPGGVIAPCSTSPGEVVTNGWSPSKRNNPFSNSGIVVSIGENDLSKYKTHGALAGLRFQQELERMAFEAGGKNLKAPAQRLIDFCSNKISSSLPESSYYPGITSAPLHELLPDVIGKNLQSAFLAFGKKKKEYYTNEAVIHGVESRTSSPVKIPRDKISLEHPQIKGLFPCGEGAGYAGGIISAAIDGERCAEAATKN